jgi:hypothetical protein
LAASTNYDGLIEQIRGAMERRRRRRKSENARGMENETAV